jgi:regulator of sigma E protease
MGFIAMLAALTLLIVLHEFGHWAIAQWRGMKTPVFSIGLFGPYLVLGRWRDTEFRLTPWLIGGYVEVPELSDASTAQSLFFWRGLNPTEARQFKVWERVVVVSAGIVMNVLTSIVLAFLLFAAIGIPNQKLRDFYIADAAGNGQTAGKNAPRPGDIILRVDGKAVQSANDLEELTSPQKGATTELTVQRGEDVMKLSLTAGQDGNYGISVGAHVETQYQRREPGDAALSSLGLVALVAGKTMEGLGMMIGIVSKPDNLPQEATEPHGIIALMQMGDVAYNSSLFGFTFLVVVVSTAMACFNILPIPALDGGHLLFCAIEALRGKPIDHNIQKRVNWMFFLLILGFMILCTFNDLYRPIPLGR